MKKLLTLLFLVATTATVFAQGTIRGTLIDSDTQEPLIGGTVRIEGNGAGAITDIDGAYSIQVPAGTYTVVHTYIGYQDKKVSDVVVTEGEVNALGNVALGIGGDEAEIDAVVITAYVQKNTEEGLLNYQMNSSKIVDAISSQSIAKTGDSDVAAVVKRVPGVTIEGGKYVFVRGLGDRYSKSILNGMQIPGLDPERNTVQMDIFPSNIIDNIVVYKTFSPDLPGDFTGGMVNVVTKDFPDEKVMKASASLGYNTESSLIDNFTTYKTDLGDLFGFGASSRKIPFADSYNPLATSAYSQENYDAAVALNNSAQPISDNSLLNGKFNFNYGNQIDINDNNNLGYIASINYSNNTSFRPNQVRNDIQIASGGVVDSANGEFRKGTVGSNEGILNGTLGVALKNSNNKYSLKVLHTRAGEKSALQREQFDLDNTTEERNRETTLDYFQRQITNAILAGEHYLKNEAEVNWSYAYTDTGVNNPDRTRTSMQYRDNNTANDLVFLSTSTYEKQWRTLEDYNHNFRADYKYPATFINDNSFLKGGVAANLKGRDFEIKTLAIDRLGTSEIPNQNLDNILDPKYIIGPDNRTGYRITSFGSSNKNKFTSDMSVLAGYVMGEIELTEKLEFIGGARVENATFNYTGEAIVTDDNGNSENKKFNDEETLNSLQILPSANFVYELKDFMNLRASYNRTLARPSFKEISGAQIFDPIKNQFFNGNIQLEETSVNNYDLRWEYYFTERELASISPFYKQFDKPIELIALSGTDVQPVNQSDASVYGFEVELRKNLGFIGTENLAINSNFTYVDSKIDIISSAEKSKYSIAGVAAPKERELLGQSPFSANVNLAYSNQDSPWEGNIGYNVKGKTLAIVGVNATPNIYEDPFHNLDLKISRKLGGEEGRSKLSLKAQNLMNDNIEYIYEFQGEKKGIYNSYDVGQTFSIGYSLDLAK